MVAQRRVGRSAADIDREERERDDKRPDDAGGRRCHVGHVSGRPVIARPRAALMAALPAAGGAGRAPPQSGR